MRLTSQVTIFGGAASSSSTAPVRYSGTQVPGLGNQTPNGDLYERCNAGNLPVTGVVGGYSVPQKIRIPSAVSGSEDYLGTYHVCNGLTTGGGLPCTERWEVRWSLIADDGEPYPSYDGDVAVREDCSGDDTLDTGNCSPPA